MSLMTGDSAVISYLHSNRVKSAGFAYNEALSPCVPCVNFIYDNFINFCIPI